MINHYRRVKIGCAGIFFSSIAVYVLYWEPYCFFKTASYSNGLSSLLAAQIHAYGPIRPGLYNKNLIAILTPRCPLRLTKILQLLDLYIPDNFTTSVLIMHSSDPYKVDLSRVAESTKRQVLFLNIEHAFNMFPVGFEPCRTKATFRTIRDKWNYHRMIRFWFKILFELPQLQDYEYIMRLDDDSKLTDKWIDVFDEMLRKHAVYFANSMDFDFEKGLPGTMNLKQITFDYIKQNNVTPKQFEVLRDAFRDDGIRTYYNNFEIMKVAFFRRQDVVGWVKAIDSTHGIFKYRWGDAILRYLTMALFAERHEVLHMNDYNLSYCHKC